MTSQLIRAALACAVLLLTATPVLAGDPIPGTDVGLDHCPPGDCSMAIANGTTDADGTVTFHGLKPGKYSVVIDGKGLVAAMDKLHPPAKTRGGDDGTHGPGGIIAILIGLLLPPAQVPHGVTPQTRLNFTVPYCRDSAGSGIRIGFTISDQAGSGNLAAKPGDVSLSISDQGATGGMTSY